MLNVPMNKEKCGWIQENCELEDVVEMPIGRLTFFMTTGNVADISCKYGRMTEPMSYVTWAEVVDEDKKTLAEVGEQQERAGHRGISESGGVKAMDWKKLKQTIDVEMHALLRPARGYSSRF